MSIIVEKDTLTSELNEFSSGLAEYLNIYRKLVEKKKLKGSVRQKELDNMEAVQRRLQHQYGGLASSISLILDRDKADLPFERALSSTTTKDYREANRTLWKSIDQVTILIGTLSKLSDEEFKKLFQKEKCEDIHD